MESYFHTRLSEQCDVVGRSTRRGRAAEALEAIFETEGRHLAN
jgi:hypothetical protein